MAEQTDPQTRLEELQMIRCSLLPDETLHFVYDAEFWESVLSELDAQAFADRDAFSAATFTLKVAAVESIWFQVTMPIGSPNGEVMVSVKSDTLPRGEVDECQGFVNEKLEEERNTEFALYNTISTHLLPLLHEYEPVAAAPAIKPTSSSTESPICHVLFTSHHIVAGKKRRNLQQWSSTLSLSGFAKVGYPGLIYAQGRQENLEQFVTDVKTMPWLLLKVRFLEPLPEKHLGDPLSGWREFTRVGEFVEEMKKLGRGEYVFEMGVGAGPIGPTA